MQAELDNVKAKIEAVGKAMEDLQKAVATAHEAIDISVAGLGAKIAVDTARSKQ